MRYVNLEEVIYIYTEIIKRTGGQPGIRDEKLLEEVLAKPLVSFEGEELYPDLFTKVSIFIYSMITNSPFIDGNKRTAILGALFIMRVNGYHMVASQENIIELAQGVETGRYKVDHLISWIRKNSIIA